MFCLKVEKGRQRISRAGFKRRFPCLKRDAIIFIGILFIKDYSFTNCTTKECLDTLSWKSTNRHCSYTKACCLKHGYF